MITISDSAKSVSKNVTKLFKYNINNPTITKKKESRNGMPTAVNMAVAFIIAIFQEATKL